MWKLISDFWELQYEGLTALESSQQVLASELQQITAIQHEGQNTHNGCSRKSH